MTSADYSAAVVTFKRPESLRGVLDSIAAQSPPPTLTVVADNDPGETARPVVDAARAEWLGELVYVAVGENLGPAGGWAAAVSAAQRHSDRGSWVLVVDDDDPLGAPGVVSSLLGSAAAGSVDIAGVGLRGARLDRRRARLRRVEPSRGESARVDYLASGGAPLYRWEAIDRDGFFVPELFFGFEDLEFGLRLQRAGWELWTEPHPELHQVADTASDSVPWREYYKTRALVWILRRHVGCSAVAVAVLRSVILGGVVLTLRTRHLAPARARVVGSLDGWRGRLGARRYLPESNPPKLGALQ